MNALWPGYRKWIALAIFLVVQTLVVGFVFTQWWVMTIAAVIGVISAWVFAVVRWQGRYLHQHRVMAQTISDLIEVAADTPIIYLTSSLRENPIALHKQTENPLTVIDLYNPQLMRAGQIGRVRDESHKHTLTTRNSQIEWLVGRIDLLPVTNNSVRVLVVDQLITALSDVANRTILLDEVRRVLAPGGQLIVVEKTRTPANSWTFGMMGMGNWQTVPAWKDILAEHRHEVIDWQKANELLFVYRADKAATGAAAQMLE